MATKIEIQINACKKRITKTEGMITRDLKKLNRKYLYLVKKEIFTTDQFDLGDERKNKKFTIKKSEKFYDAVSNEIEKIRLANLVSPQNRDQAVWEALFDARAYANDFRIDTRGLACEKEELKNLESKR